MRTLSSALVQSGLNTLAQLLVYFVYLPAFFRVNNTQVSELDYLYFGAHAFAVFLAARLFLTLPLLAAVDRKWPQYSRLVMAITESFFFVFTVVDSLAYLDQGVHVYDSIVVRTLMNPNFMREVQLTAFSFITLGVAWGLLIAAQLGLWRLFQEKALFGRRANWACAIVMALFAASVAVDVHAFRTHFPRLGESASLYPFYVFFRPTPKQGPLIVDYEYPPAPKLASKKDVYFIMAESLRSDMATPKFMKGLMDFVSSRNCLVPEHHYSGGHTTEYGVFTALYGLYGMHYNDFSKNGMRSYGLDVLKQNGYELRAGTASQLSTWMGAGFMFTPFDEYREFKSKVVYQDDAHMVDWAIEERKKEREHPLFMFLFFNSTHHGYHYPPEFARHQPALEENFNQFKLGANSPEELQSYQQKMYNRYLNSVEWVDHNLSRFLNSLDEGRDALVVFTGDHGEEFWEEGLLGHSRTNFINPRVRVPLFVCEARTARGRPKHLSVPLSSHADIFPTLISLLGGGRSTEQFNGHDLTDERLRQIRPYIVITPPQFPYEKTKIALVSEKAKLWLKKTDADMHDLELVRATDINDRSLDANTSRQFAEEMLRSFSRDAYRFLRPSAAARASSSGPR